MLDLISSYLLLNRECSIPSLGLLRMVRKSARVDIVNRQLLPPVEEVSFLDEPAISLGELIDYVARSMKIEPQEASGRLTAFFNTASANINSGGVLEIKQVGSLQKNSEGIIYLNPYKSPGYFLPVAANAVIRANTDHDMLVGDKETTSVAMTEYLNEQSNLPAVKWKIWALILTIISILALAYYYYTHSFSLNSLGNSSGIS